MKLAGYIFKLFLPLLLGALVLFCLAFEIVDLFMNMWKYLSNNVPVPVIASGGAGKLEHFIYIYQRRLLFHFL